MLFTLFRLSMRGDALAQFFPRHPRESGDPVIAGVLRNHDRRGVLGPPLSRRTTPVVYRAVWPLQPQHRLGNDIALDLVGAAIDRDLAVVEIARRDLGGPVHGLVGA